MSENSFHRNSLIRRAVTPLAVSSIAVLSACTIEEPTGHISEPAAHILFEGETASSTENQETLPLEAVVRAYAGKVGCKYPDPITIRVVGQDTMTRLRSDPTQIAASRRGTVFIDERVVKSAAPQDKQRSQNALSLALAGACRMPDETPLSLRLSPDEHTTSADGFAIRTDIIDTPSIDRIDRAASEVIARFVNPEYTSSSLDDNTRMDVMQQLITTSGISVAQLAHYQQTHDFKAFLNALPLDPQTPLGIRASCVLAAFEAEHGDSESDINSSLPHPANGVLLSISDCTKNS